VFKIIIVDDEKWTRETIKQFGRWEKYGIEVIGEASDGQEGLRLIEEMSPDIVITDMKMPGMDGIELLQVLTERFPHIKLIVVSGYDDFVYMRQAIYSKVNEYLLKPINVDELNLALEKCTNEIKSQWDPFFYQSFWFTSKDLSSLIMEYKKTITSFFQDLNISGFENAQQRFYDQLKKMEGIDRNVLFKIQYEFVHILEEQIIKNGCNVTDIFEKHEYLHDRLELSLDRMMEQQRVLGKRFIEYMINLNKKKKRVNLQEIKEYIDRNFADSHISLEILANKFFVSKEYLSKAFKNTYGCNITEYIVSRRMEQAKKLLQDNELQIKSIAQMVGYEDVSYFYRVFKKYFKISPGEMRSS
jgi:two-component system, response regulator YesN